MDSFEKCIPMTYDNQYDRLANDEIAFNGESGHEPKISQ